MSGQHPNSLLFLDEDLRISTQFELPVDEL
jgi:hypothetical protein